MPRDFHGTWYRAQGLWAKCHTALPKTQDVGVTTVNTLEMKKMKLKRPHNMLKSSS